jgi:hypothetical protein
VVDKNRKLLRKNLMEVVINKIDKMKKEVEKNNQKDH